MARRSLAGNAVVLVLSLLSASACGFSSNQRETHWATGAEAEADGAMQPGRLPAWLPEAARDVKERRDPGARMLWVRFEVPPAERASVAAGCDVVEPLLVSRPGPTRGVSWWPVLLQSDFAKAGDQFEFRRCESAGAVGWVALHRSMPAVFYWETGSR